MVVLLAWTIAQAPPVDALGQLAQWGALGIINALLLWFAWQAYKGQKDRGDRLEAQLTRQNELIQSQIVGALVKANEAIAQFLEQQRQRQRNPR